MTWVVVVREEHDDYGEDGNIPYWSTGKVRGPFETKVEAEKVEAEYIGDMYRDAEMMELEA